MVAQNIIGIFFHFDLKFIPEEIINYLKKIPEIALIKTIDNEDFYKGDSLEKEINDKNLTKIIIAGDMPGIVKSFFTKVMIKAGKKAEDVSLISFNELGVYSRSDNDRAIAAFLSNIYEIPIEKLLSSEQKPVNADTLVIGAGIAGIQASLEVADANKKVFLIEKTGTIGGHMALFDKTFPTLDCAACILTPKMVEVGQHAHIELSTYAEVKSVTGIPGNYKVTILQKARKVDILTCIGCGSCSAKCPNTVPSEFDTGTTLRKAIYIPFPQAVPNKYLVDADNCRYIDEPFAITGATIKDLRKIEKLDDEILNKLETLKNKDISDEKDFENQLNNAIGSENAKKYKGVIFKHSGKCKNCIRFCPVNDCINLDEQDKEYDITVGNIIVATGFKIFDAKKATNFGYGIFPNVLTALELERLINASGPTEGKITLRTEDKKGNKIFTKDGVIPKSVAVIHCVGSRDKNHNEYCSKVCCMYSLKLSHLVKEKLPEAEVSEYFIDMRAFGKGYEEFYERIKKENVNIIRGKTAKVEQVNGQLQIRGENILEDKLIEDKVDMVVLSVGLEPSDDTNNISKMLGLTTSKEGWLNEIDSNSNPTGTLQGGITIAGVCQGPKDIPDTVAQASAAASSVLQSIIKNQISDNANISLQDIENNLKKYK